MVEEESKNRKMDELGAEPAGKGHEAVVEEKSDHEIFKLDSQVLDCNICFKPLKPPIFQVTTWHTSLLAHTSFTYYLIRPTI
jgi:E3 ubiquitin-protein ligase SIAH1